MTHERFTDRARKVMLLANQEAQRFNHEYIGTEHILLGLVKEGSGIAAHVLKNLDVDLRKVRLEVERLIQSGPEMVTMGKLPQTPRAKKVIEFSMEEARNLDHNYVGTEHILLGLLREEEGVAAQVLVNLGLKLKEIREEVLYLLGTGLSDNFEPPKDPVHRIENPQPADILGRELCSGVRKDRLRPFCLFFRASPYFAQAQDLINKAADEYKQHAVPLELWGELLYKAYVWALEMRHTVVDVDHILLVLYQQENTVSAKILAGLMHLEELAGWVRSGHRGTPLSPEGALSFSAAVCELMPHITSSLPDDRLLDTGDILLEVVALSKGQELLRAAGLTDFLENLPDMVAQVREQIKAN